MPHGNVDRNPGKVEAVNGGRGDFADVLQKRKYWRMGISGPVKRGGRALQGEVTLSKEGAGKVWGSVDKNSLWPVFSMGRVLLALLWGQFFVERVCPIQSSSHGIPATPLPNTSSCSCSQRSPPHWGH